MRVTVTFSLQRDDRQRIGIQNRFGRRLHYSMPLILLGLLVTLTGCVGTVHSDAFQSGPCPTDMTDQSVVTSTTGLRSIRGTVSDADGKPLGGVALRWILDVHPALSPTKASRVSGFAETSGTGTYELQVPEIDGHFSLWCSLAGRWRQLLSGLWSTYDPWNSPLDAELIPADKSFRLVVTTMDGTPIAGADAQLVIGQGGSPIGDRWSGAASDHDGRVIFQFIEHEGYFLDVSSPGFATMRVMPRHLELRIDPGSEPDVVRLPVGRTVRGLVTLPDGSPPSGGSVSFWYSLEGYNDPPHDYPHHHLHHHLHESWIELEPMGRFAIVVPRDYLCWIVVKTPDGAMGEVESGPGETIVRVRLDPVVDRSR